VRVQRIFAQINIVRNFENLRGAGVRTGNPNLRRSVQRRLHESSKIEMLQAAAEYAVNQRVVQDSRDVYASKIKRIKTYLMTREDSWETLARPFKHHPKKVTQYWGTGHNCGCGLYGGLFSSFSCLVSPN